MVVDKLIPVMESKIDKTKEELVEIFKKEIKEAVKPLLKGHPLNGGTEKVITTY
jgi:hypothetical protein